MGLGILIFATLVIDGVALVALHGAFCREAPPAAPKALAAIDQPASSWPGDILAVPEASYAELPRGILHVSWRCPEYGRWYWPTLANLNVVDTWDDLAAWYPDTAYSGHSGYWRYGAPWIGFTLDDICTGVPWAEFARDFDYPGSVVIGSPPLFHDQKNIDPRTTAVAVPEPGAYALMLASLGLIAIATRRRTGAARERGEPGIDNPGAYTRFRL